MRSLWKIIKQSFLEFIEDDCLSSAAASAYYSIFALPPLMVIVFMAVSYAGVSQKQVRGVVENQVGIPLSGVENTQEDSSGNDGQQQESSQTPLKVSEERAKPGRLSDIGGLGRIAGTAILVFTATGLFAQLQYSLNRAWDVQPDPQSGGVRQFLVKRVFSLGLIVVLAFLLLISLVLSALIDQVIGYVQGRTPDTLVWLLGITLNNLVTLVWATLLFAAMFKILPDANVAWRDTWLAAAATAVLFLIGKSVIAQYLQRSGIGASWSGAAASLMAILAWLYYTSLIVLFGAELSQVWVRHSGRAIQPSRGAARISETGRRENEHKQASF